MYARYHVMWMFPDHWITQDTYIKCNSEIWKHLWDIIQRSDRVYVVIIHVYLLYTSKNNFLKHHLQQQLTLFYFISRKSLTIQMIYVWHFMWIICYAELYEMSGLIFSDKYKKVYLSTIVLNEALMADLSSEDTGTLHICCFEVMTST